MLKRKDKFEINWHHYLTNWNKPIYADNRIKEKALQYQEFGLYKNEITTFAIIKNLFNYLQDIFSNFYERKFFMKKFLKLKKEASGLNDFYSKFIWLASDVKYTSQIVIQKLKHELILCLQGRSNSKIEVSTRISKLINVCLSIYMLLEATNWIRNRIKLLQSISMFDFI